MQVGVLWSVIWSVLSVLRLLAVREGSITVSPPPCVGHRGCRGSMYMRSYTHEGFGVTSSKHGALLRIALTQTWINSFRGDE